MAASTDAVKHSADRELAVARVVDAFQALVLMAWTEPGPLARVASPEGAGPCVLTSHNTGSRPMAAEQIAPAGQMPGTTTTTDRDIISTREFDAPRERVFQAWMDPAVLAQWWGPAGFTNTFHEFNPQPGGVWQFVMHGPDGKNYKNKSVFREVIRPERIVFDHESGPLYHATVTFAEQGGKTRLTWSMRFESATAFAAIKDIAVEGNRQNLDKLAAQLAKMG